MSPTAFLVGQLMLAWNLYRTLDKLRSVAQPTVYRSFTLRESIWLLWNVDHKGREAFYDFAAATVAFFWFPIFAAPLCN